MPLLVPSAVLPPWRSLLVDWSSPTRALRAENGELRAQLAEHGRANGLLVEENAALRDQVDALAAQVAELQRRLGQTPRNSDKPPSSEGYAKPAPKSRRSRSGRKPGGQPGHPGRTLRQVDDPDEVVRHTPRRCGCGRSLRHGQLDHVERRQVVDLPEIRRRVIEHHIEHRVCRCGQVVGAGEADGVPATARGPISYGPGVRALGSYLLAAHYLPSARAAQLLSDVLDLPVAEGSLVAWYLAAAERLDPFVEQVKAGLAGSDVVGADESGARVAAKLAWVHTAVTSRLTFYDVFTGPGARGADAMRAMGILPALSADAVLVSDFWSPYWEFDLRHQVCLAHIGRELVAAAEVAGQQEWASGLDTLLDRLIGEAHAARDAGADRLEPELLARYQAHYDELVTAGWAANPDYPPAERRRRKRPKHVNLLDRLDSHRDELLRFAEDLRVPATNNSSERSIRPLKIRIKVSGCLRTMAGAKAFCRLRSYLDTARKQGQPALAVLRMLHDSGPWIPAIA